MYVKVAAAVASRHLAAEAVSLQDCVVARHLEMQPLYDEPFLQKCRDESLS